MNDWIILTIGQFEREGEAVRGRVRTALRLPSVAPPEDGRPQHETDPDRVGTDPQGAQTAQGALSHLRRRRCCRKRRHAP